MASVSPEAARKVLAANQDALVIVEGVLKAEVLLDGVRQGKEAEHPVKVSGFVVDSSGLVLVSSYHLNPVGTMARKPIRLSQDGQTVEVEMRTRLEDLRIRKRDGAELPARVALEDADLGLMLVKPEPKEGSPSPVFKAVQIENAATGTAFTQYLIVDQGEATFRNDLVLETGLISGVLAKPHTLLLQDLGRSWMFVGAPFFDLGGRLLGMGLMHVRPMRDPTEGASQSAPLPAIVPAADIQDMVRRALKQTDGPKPAPPGPASLDRWPELAAEKATAIFESAKSGVVVVTGSVRYKCVHCAEEHEAEMEGVGAVLDPKGLIVIASGGECSGNKYLEQHLRCVLADGSEVPVAILLHDDDLLLTVLEPVEPKASADPAFKPLRLDPKTQAELADDTVTLGRLGRENHYVPSVAVGRVGAVARQPRLFYQVHVQPPSASAHGLPVFTGDGALLGLTAPDPQAEGWDSDDDGGNPLAGQHGPSRIIPAAALAELLDHARKAQAEAKSK
jgi:hypothetical protein